MSKFACVGANSLARSADKKNALSLLGSADRKTRPIDVVSIGMVTPQPIPNDRLASLE